MNADFDESDTFEKFRRLDNAGNKLPVGRFAAAKQSSKQTWRSKRANKKIARTISGIRNRRHRK